MRSHIVPLSPSLLVAAANAIVGVGEQGGDNRGQMIDLFLKSVALPPGQPWCAAFVHHVGRSSHYDQVTGRSSWPLPATGSCDALARAVHPHRYVVGVQDEERVHLRDVHACITVEGNTNDDGSSNGHTTLCKTRLFYERDGHKFIRWTEMLRRAEAA